MNLEEHELPTRISNILYKGNLTTHKSILETQECDFRRLGYVLEDDITNIYSVTSHKAKTSEFISGNQLQVSVHPRWRRLSTGCPRIDSLLRGGVLTRGVTELAGHSGCGKTQLCLQLAIVVQLPHSFGGLSAGAAYICTEGNFPSKRLNQLVKTCPAAKQFQNIKFTNNVFVEHMSDAADLLKCVEERLPQLLTQQTIGLVVVDSVAGVFRAEYTPAEAVQRALDLRAFASRLHALANTFNIAVVCVNQVTDVKRGEESQTVPALGLAWANLVTCRLQMFRTNSGRELRVVFTPDLPQSSLRFEVTESGVQGSH